MSRRYACPVLTTREVADRIEIADLLTAYTRAIDKGAWGELDGVFTPDAMIDYTSAGGISGPFPEVKAWLAGALEPFVRRQHVLGQLEVNLDGDTARVTAYFVNPMITRDGNGDERLFRCGGYYHHELVRTGDGWRSRRLTEETVWTR